MIERERESLTDSKLYPPTNPDLLPLSADSISRRIRNIGILRLVFILVALGIIHLALDVPIWPVWRQLGGGVSAGALLLALISSIWGKKQTEQIGITPYQVFIQVLLDQLIITLLVYLSGGVSSALTPLYGITCLVAGYLLGVRGAVFATFFAVVFFSALLLLIEAAVLPRHLGPIIFHDLGESRDIFLVLTNVMMLAVVALLTSHLFERLSRAGGELEEAGRKLAFAKKMAELGRLSSGLAHEIRNPLSSINGAMHLLQEVQTQSEDKKLCEIVLQESARLEDLVEDMLNLSRSTAPNKESFNMSEVLESVVSLARTRGRGIDDVHINLQAPPNIEVVGDQGQVRQMVWNLLRNAIQSSEAGGEARIILTSEEDAVILKVEDDGAGISKEAQKRIFDAYFTTRTQGTGIGLAVVKRIIREHEFTIRVQSEEGKGAQFWVKLS